jgi:hypothetical protein
MVNHSLPHLPFSSQTTREASKAREQRGPMSFKIMVLKWLGFTATLMLFTAAMAPDVLKVPLHWRPWVFVTSIFWFLAFCAGIFNQ